MLRISIQNNKLQRQLDKFDLEAHRKVKDIFKNLCKSADIKTIVSMNRHALLIYDGRPILDLLNDVSTITAAFCTHFPGTVIKVEFCGWNTLFINVEEMIENFLFTETKKSQKLWEELSQNTTVEPVFQGMEDTLVHWSELGKEVKSSFCLNFSPAQFSVFYEDLRKKYFNEVNWYEN